MKLIDEERFTKKFLEEYSTCNKTIKEVLYAAFSDQEYDDDDIKEPAYDQDILLEEKKVNEKEVDEFNKHLMKLTPIEYARFKKFQEEHKHKDINTIEGCIGLKLIFTGIGVAKICHCGICGENCNITDYNW